ncbi:MAG: patatin-like phospholipase family protein [Solirubrobacteraceae bacterium]|nr:patatin-like phospholipase family protein [Solirubrobacteraceae bacterium]
MTPVGTSTPSRTAAAGEGARSAAQPAPKVPKFRLPHVRKVDLVLAGGGVKGIAHVGALKALHDHGYTEHPRIAGTSVGAIVGALVAQGYTPCEIWDILYAFDFSTIPDAYPSRWPLLAQVAERVSELLPLPGSLGGLLDLRQRQGVHPGHAATAWLRSVFEVDGRPQTFGELRRLRGLSPSDPPPLVIMATDVKLGRLVQFPRDYGPLYGVDPDAQSIFEAVRASMSIPLFFEPYRIQAAKTESKAGKPASPGINPKPPARLSSSRFVDGGVLANFAVDVLDRQGDGVAPPPPPRWPTFGITLLRNEPPASVGRDLRNGIADFGALDDELLGDDLSSFTDSLIGTLVVGQDANASQHWWMANRTIRVETKPYGIVQFSVDGRGKKKLFKVGYESTEQFLHHEWPAADHVGFDGRAHFPIPEPTAGSEPCKGTA